MIERKNNRSKLEIFACMLNLSKFGIKKTHLMQEANLNSQQMGIYFSELVDKYFLQPTISHTSIIYSTTDKGKKYLHLFGCVTELTGQELMTIKQRTR